MKYSYLILAITFFSLIQAYPVSDDKNISVHQLPIMDDLPSNSIYRLIQDKEGYMWFGTQDGLCRYDGYQTKVFRSDINNTSLLTSNHITSLSEDIKERIWIGTDDGLNILDKSTYSISPHPDTLLRGKEIYTIQSASDSTIWVGYNGGIRHYNIDLTLQDEFATNSSSANSIPLANANHIYEDSYQNIWVLLWEKGLYKFNKENKQFIKYPEIGRHNNPFNIFQDDQNNYWIGTWDEGLYHFNPNNINTNTYHKISLPKWSYNDSRFYSFAQDGHNNYIWAMSLSGLTTFRYDDQGQVVVVDTKEALKNTNNIFSQIITDKSGNLWIGAFSEGVFKIDFDKVKIRNFPSGLLNNRSNIAPSFTNICVDNEDQVWFNQNRLGLFMYSPQTQSIHDIEELNATVYKHELLSIKHINFIYSLNEVWISNDFNDKIVRFKKNGFKIQLINDYDLSKVKDNPGTALVIFEDNHSNVWIGTETSLFVKFANNDSITLVKENIGRILSITQDINNTIWLGTNDNAILKLAFPTGTPNQITDSIISPLQYKSIDKHIQSVAADKSGILWFGTKEGHLIAYNILNKTFSNRTLDCGLNGEAILDIITDKYNNVWVMTYKKVIEYNPQNNASYSYTKDDGMQINSHLVGSYFKTKDEKHIYIGGNRGYSRFSSSERLLAAPQQTDVKITDIRIQNESIFNNQHSSVYDNKTKTLTLYPSDKNVELHFSTLTYDSPNKIRYAYKLDGIDKDWIETKGDRLFAVYNQLNKGTYNFWVKSTDLHNLWSNKVTMLTIIREPAFYETNLAIMIYIVLIAISIYMLFNVMIGRVKLRNKIKMAEFEKNKTEELTQTKLKYFTNISHDLLTPLTIISCLIDDLETTSPQKYSQFTIMRSNVARLKRLLEQILDFRRIESGNMKLNITQSEITSFINDICYNHFLPILSKKKIRFSFHSNPKEIYGYFDADKVDKVMFNLLSNAFKFTLTQGEISINLNEFKKNDLTFLSIKVSDTGVGIAPKDIEQVFTRFYTNKTLKSGDTHGIGLSLCKDLIELHHGNISVESILGKGTTFTIQIPIDKNSYSNNEIAFNTMLGVEQNDKYSNENESEITPIESDNNFSTSLLRNVNILIVDDNQELLNLMKQMLSRNYHILTATNGIEALESVKANNIDIIVSDVMMPEMDGIELCRNLKGDIESSHISVILLTAKNSINDRIECYNAGADAYISKPFEMGVLQARINNFITNKQSKQQEFKATPEINISQLENHTMDEQFLNHTIEIIEKHIAKTEFDVNQFAEELNLSKSTLYRKIKTLTGLSPVEFIRNIKLKHASEMLKNTTTSISEVAYAVGFSDPKYFSSCFKTEFNITPSEYQRKQLKDKPQ